MVYFFATAASVLAALGNPKTGDQIVSGEEGWQVSWLQARNANECEPATGIKVQLESCLLRCEPRKTTFCQAQRPTACAASPQGRMPAPGGLPTAKHLTAVFTRAARWRRQPPSTRQGTHSASTR